MAHCNAAAFPVITPNTPRAEHGERRSVSRFPVVRIRVGTFDLDPVRATGLHAIYEGHPGIEIVVLDTGKSAEVASWLDPTLQILVLGVQPGRTTFDLLATIRAARPDLHVLVMSPATGDEAVLNVLCQGAKGFLHEGAKEAEFEEAVRTIASGAIWASRRIQAILIGRLLSARNSYLPPAKVDFTKRERQVLDLLLKGRSNREIARSLKIKERTVKSYVAKLMRKMGVKNRTALSMRVMSS